jgi:hypothetical protein
LLQALICRRNPVTGDWYTRFRGFVEEMDYSFDPSQQVNRLELSLVDIFEFIAAIELFPGYAGITPPDPDSADQVYYPGGTDAGGPYPMDVRINQILDDTIGPVAKADYTVVFTGNVNLHPTTISPGESAMDAIQEAAEAEWPGVSNVYTDRLGRLAVHGRLAKFDPAGVLAGAAPGAWDWHSFKAGDGTIVASDPAHYAHIRRFAFNRGLAKIINSAFATPQRRDSQLTGPEMAGQYISNSSSIAEFGIRSWSAQDLLTFEGVIDSSTDLVETKRFATYYVQNYAFPQNRVTEIGFRSMDPAAAGASENWRLLSLVDISDEVLVTVESPGGGFFADEPYYVEGVHEQVGPLVPDYDDVTLTLDLSPQAFFPPPGDPNNPFP